VCIPCKLVCRKYLLRVQNLGTWVDPVQRQSNKFSVSFLCMIDNLWCIYFHHDKTEILLKVALNTINLTKLALCVIHLNCEIQVPTDNIVKERLIF
jgi:hypothetical protein